MAFFGIGEKDAQGRQKRVEHRGRHLRISRTGGVALRAQTRRAGLTLTANTSQGLRVSTGIAKNTQVALQNGRFVLRGRYGDGPLHANLSKSGLSISTRTRFGTVNLTRPGSSSFKFAGIQLRGRKAVWLQLAAMIINLVVELAMFAFQLLLALCQLLVAVGLWLWDVLSGLPERWRLRRRQQRNAALEAQLDGGVIAVERLFANADREHLVAALVLLLAEYGRGIGGSEATARARRLIAQHATEWPLLLASQDELDSAALVLAPLAEDGQHALAMAALARRIPVVLDAEDTTEVLLQADELAVTQAPRTELQETLLQVFSDFADLRLQPSHTHPHDDASSTLEKPAPADRQKFTGLDLSAPDAVDLNRAGMSELATLPHIGPGRAAAIIALRPIDDIAQLQAIKGIGPARLEDIRAAGVRL